MLTYKEAQQQLVAHARSFGKEIVDLDNAGGRILAEDIRADRDYPPFHRAAMDGYALAFSDYQRGVREYEVVEIIFAGQTNTRALAPGQCFKIMTGAAVPSPADTVIRREDAVQEGQKVRFQLEDCRPFQHISRQGEDCRANEKILPAGCFGTASVIALLASVGKTRVQVEKLPAVAIFTTGDEVVPPDHPVTPVQIRNSNQYLLKALLKQWQIDPVYCAHIPDNKEKLYETFARSLNLDTLIICGGVSAGDADYVPGVLESLGVKKLFHKLSIKPGKPIWCGRLPSGTMIFALPGNPFSCQVTFRLFVNTYFSACFGLETGPAIHLPVVGPRQKKTPLDEFFPARYNRSLSALEPISFNGSGDIRAGFLADGLGIHPATAGDLAAGEIVEFIPGS